jgi:hypothetical protein
MYAETNLIGLYSSIEAAYKAFKEYLLAHVKYARDFDRDNNFNEEITHFECCVCELIDSISESVPIYRIWLDFQKIESKFAEATRYCSITVVNVGEEINLEEIVLDQPIELP